MFDSGGDSVILYCINSWLDVLQATDKSIMVWLIWEVWLKLMPCLDWNIGKLGNLRTGTSCGVQGGGMCAYEQVCNESYWGISGNKVGHHYKIEQSCIHRLDQGYKVLFCRVHL